jgi:hypothetical protein
VTLIAHIRRTSSRGRHQIRRQGVPSQGCERVRMCDIFGDVPSKYDSMSNDLQRFEVRVPCRQRRSVTKDNGHISPKHRIRGCDLAAFGIEQILQASQVAEPRDNQAGLSCRCVRSRARCVVGFALRRSYVGPDQAGDPSDMQFHLSQRHFDKSDCKENRA